MKNLENNEDVFYSNIYPEFALEFLTGSNYEEFAKIVQNKYILSSKQWGFILDHWEEKERILS